MPLLRYHVQVKAWHRIKGSLTEDALCGPPRPWFTAGEGKTEFAVAHPPSMCAIPYNLQAEQAR